MYYWFINNSFKRKTQLSDYSIQDKHGKVKKIRANLNLKVCENIFKSIFIHSQTFQTAKAI